MGKMKKKYESGEGARYITRNRALKYLQLTLKDFRRLCILKGIYPREPKNRKRAQKGDTSIRTLYYKKDIQFLSHEPNIWKLRELKVIYKKMCRAKSLKEKDDVAKYRDRIPLLKLDHIVKERYPTFIDALRDLDDCLTLLFLFAAFPKTGKVPEKYVTFSRRLTVEFMHYVIAAKALRKVFISIKGYYFQAEIKGQSVTWIVPHQFVIDRGHYMDVDFQVMLNFVDFYQVLLGFVNFRLYHSLNMTYPPTFPGYSAVDSEKNIVDEEVYASERIASLNVDLARVGGSVGEDEDEGIDEFPMIEDQEQLEELKKKAEKVKTQKRLFKGLKIFINREVPREPLVFVIRCLGGQVSWSKTTFIGATFDESDETITHQIVDRPMVDKQYISRYYVQPQWVFDSVNACELLPVEKYFIGAVLPPHLSPFQSEHKLDQYMPPEELALQDPEIAKQLDEVSGDESSEPGEDDIEGGSCDEDDGEVESDQESDEKMKQNVEDVEEGMDELEKERQRKKNMMSVKAGKVVPADPYASKKQEREDYKLRVTMIRNKHRKLYHSMVKGQKKRKTEAWLLRKKRTRYEEEQSQKRKEQRREQILAQAEAS
ncbi:Pescadillo homolog [Gryllus bimaculatus]|nr:Pescadillo homolog [Gryllus bimaculatus]